MSGGLPPEDNDTVESESLSLQVKAQKERRQSVVLFLLTLLSTFWVYGTQFMGQDTFAPFTDGAVAWESGKFAIGLMAILLAHEMGHYVVAKMHGFALSLPYFIPFPFGFGTFGAVIRLRSLPRTRTGLLEMGAAGPIAGFVVAILMLFLGLWGGVSSEPMVLTVEWPPVGDPPPSPEPGMLDWLVETPQLGEIPATIFANPPAMDLIGWLLNGEIPGRYDSLDALAMAGWVGCLLTALNLVPIGQLDGGHIFNAIWPKQAALVSKILLLVLVLCGVFWVTWAFWAILLYVMRAWMSLPVPYEPLPSRRSMSIAGCTLVAFGLCFMPQPIQFENIPIEEFEMQTPEGEVVDPADYRTWLEQEEPSGD